MDARGLFRESMIKNEDLTVILDLNIPDPKKALFGMRIKRVNKVVGSMKGGCTNIIWSLFQ